MASTALVPGASDCELLRTGVMAQPANTISSFAFVLGGVAVAMMASRSGAWRSRSLVYAACLVATGLGSVAYHGPQPPGAELVHDLSIDFALALIAFHNLGLLVTRAKRVLVNFAGFSLVLTFAAALVLPIAALVADVLVVAVITTEVLVYRRRLRVLPKVQQRQFVMAITLAMITAGFLFAVGRTESPLCDPSSLLQAHAGWHVVAAGVFTLWWWLALGRNPGEDAPC